MSLLSLSEFLHIFDSPKEPSFSEFMKNAVVRVNSQMYPLKTYQANKNIPLPDLRLLYENIINRNEYLTRFYNLSLEVTAENTDFHKDPPMENRKMNNNYKPLFKNLIRNMHYRYILQKTKSGIDTTPTYLNMLTDLYKKHIIDYKLLTPSARFYMNEGRLGSVFSSYYFRASIMNPFLVYSLQESLLKATRVFTPTLGWTSYCYGFLESPKVKEYVGIDVIPAVCEKTKLFANMHSPQVKTSIYCSPSEVLAKDLSFRKKYARHFDVAFFSPPYFRLELYAGQQQSTTQYTSYTEWLEKYWKATVELCHHVLQKEGRMCYILSGYGSKNVKEEYDLLKDMNRITKKYFRLIVTKLMHNKNVHVTSENHRNTAEKIMLFLKDV
jgi:hypothetical protein